MAANKIYIQVDFQSTDAQAQIDAINQKIQGIGTSAQQATTQASQGVKSFSVSIDQATNSVNQFAAALTGMGLARVITELATVGEQMNRIRRAFASTAGGEDALKQIDQLAESSRFSSQELKKSANELKNLGVAMKDIPVVIKSFSEQVDLAAGNQEDLNTALTAFGNLSNQQYVNARTLVQQFGKIGIQVMDMVSKATGQSVQMVRNQQREMNAAVLQQMIVLQSQINTLQKGGQGSGALGTTGAALGQLKTEIGKAAEAFDEAFGPSIARLLRLLVLLLQAFESVLEVVKKIPAPIRDMAVALAAMAVAAGAVTAAIAAWNTLVPIITSVTAAIEGARLVTLGLAEAEAVAEVAGIAFEVPMAAIAAAAVAAAGGIALLMDSTNKQGAAAEKNGGLIDQLKAKLKDLSKGLFGVDEEKLQRQREAAVEHLYEAEKRNKAAGLESIAALGPAYDALTHKLIKDDETLANYRKAYAIDVVTEVKKRNQELQKENEKLIQESYALDRKIAVAAAGEVPDETFAGRTALAKKTAEAETQQFEQQFAERARIANELTRKQDAAVMASTRLTEQEKLDAIKHLEEDNATYVANLYAVRDKQIAEHTLKTNGETNKLLQEQEKRMREESLQDQLDFIQKSSQQAIEYANAEIKQTLPARLAQINQVRDLQTKQIEDTRKARLDAAQAEFDTYKGQHSTFQAGIEEAESELAHTRVMVNREADAAINADRLKAWKDANSAIIEEQRKVYDSIKSAFDKVWDAFMDRSKSVWQSLANAAKQAMVGIAKELITSRLAAGMTAAITGRGVTFAGGPRGLGGTAPVFEGAGPPPVMKQLEGATSAMRFDISRSMSNGSAALISAGGALSSSAGALTAAANALTAAGAVAGAPANAVAAANTAIQSSAASAASASSAASTASGAVTGGTPAWVGGAGTATTPPFIPSSGGATGGAGGMMSSLGGLFGISPGGTSFSSILNSKGVAGIAGLAGTGLFMSGLRSRSTGQTIAGGALTGFGLASTMGMTGYGGAITGAGAGLYAAGLMRGGLSGLAMDVGGGALVGMQFGGPLGAAIGAGVGLISGLIRLGIPGFNQEIRSKIKSVYGIDIANKQILQQIADIINQRYGGSISVGVYSQEVQDLVRLYALSTGQHAALPRPMYSATFAQSGAGGLQLQPVYSGGQLVANPYVGATTTQYANALALSQSAGSVHIQLNPQQAMSLFSGEVVTVISNNPAAVGQANTSAARTGINRVGQAGSLMEPLTVVR